MREDARHSLMRRRKARLLPLAGIAGVFLLPIGLWWIELRDESSMPLAAGITREESKAAHQNPDVSALSKHATAETPWSPVGMPESILPEKVAVAVNRIKRLRQDFERANTTLLTVSRSASQLAAIAVLTAPTAAQVETLRSTAHQELEQFEADGPDYILLQKRLNDLLEDEFAFESPKKLVLVTYNLSEDSAGFGEFFGTDESGITYGEGGKIEITSPSARYVHDRERYDYLLRDAVEAEAAKKVEDAYREP